MKEITKHEPRILTDDELAVCAAGIALPERPRLDIADLTYLGLEGSQHGQE